MNILIYRYGSICEPDIIEAFNRMSVHVDEVTDEIYNKKITPAEGITVLKKRLDSGTAYSLVFTVNFFPWIAEVCSIYGIMYFSLIVDSPVMELYSIR